MSSWQLTNCAVRPMTILILKTTICRLFCFLPFHTLFGHSNGSFLLTFFTHFVNCYEQTIYLMWCILLKLEKNIKSFNWTNRKIIRTVQADIKLIFCKSYIKAKMNFLEMLGNQTCK